MKLRPGALLMPGFLFLATILLLRTTGLHIDEWSYLFIGIATIAGVLHQV